MSREERTVNLEDVRAASERIRGVAHRTPVLTSRTLNDRVGASVFVKAENLQKGGAFKIRGAYSRMSTLSSAELAAGVATYSSGNHAQAVAIAARELGTTAVILMPEDTPAGKVAATMGYGAEVVRYDRYREDREELGERLARDRGLTMVPPYEHPLVIAGQGTAGLELWEDAGPLDVLLAPIGGGGLIAGSGTAVKGLGDSVRVVGVEPEAGDDTRRSLEAGELVRLPEVPRTIADGLQAHIPGHLTFSINRRMVDEVVTVSDEHIRDAMRFLFERMKIVAEPSGAVGIAALLAGRFEAPGRRIGVIISGGNIDAARFAELLGAGPA